MPFAFRGASRKRRRLERLLFTFNDLFEKAYATASYVRHEYEDGTLSKRLATAKSMLVP